MKNASTNSFQVRRWWTCWPGANPGIRTGGKFVVFDADHGADGLAEAAKYDITLQQIHAKTGNGHHFPFRVPEGVVLRNKSKASGGWPFEHCDARGEGGYIVAAPSRHPTGRRYEWSGPFDVATLPEIPPALLEVWQDAPDDPRNEVPLGDDDADADDEAEASGGDGLGEVTAEYFLARYTRVALDGGADRNPTGFALGCQLRDAPLPRQAAVPYMRRYQQAVEHARPGKPAYTWAEAESSLNQAYSREPRAQATSDVGMVTWAARRYLAAYGDHLRYDHVNKRWLAWNGVYWKPNLVGEAGRLAQKLMAAFYVEAGAITDDGRRKAAISRVLKLDNAGSIRGMVSLAAEWGPIRAEPSLFDGDPWLATVANGTLDLRLDRAPSDGVALLREHRQADMLTRKFGKSTPLAYIPGALCPEWEAFLRRIFIRADGSPDEELIGYLQRWAGYALTGMVTEQMLLVCHGDGQNGKRTFVRALSEVLGDYAETISIETLLAQRFEGNAGPAELARLDGARFVECGENDAGRWLNEPRVKLLTGNDPVPARRLRGDPFFYDPQFKLLLHTNHKPKIRGRDKGIWRRVKLIPFTVTIPEGERDPLFYEHRLAAELPGIFAWTVRGCLEWQRVGPGEPVTVTAATAEYRNAEDIVRQFVSERMVKDAAATEWQKVAYAEFGAWCAELGLRRIPSSIAFGDRVSEVAGIERTHRNGGNVFLGLRLRLAPDGERENQ